MTLLVLVVLVACTAVGFGLASGPRLGLGPEERLAASGPLGALVVSLACWAWSVGLGFSLTTVGLGLATATLASLPGWSRAAPTVVADGRALWRRARLPWRDPESLVPLVALLAVAWPLTIRIVALAWQTRPDGSLAAGHLSTWSDGAAHLAYAGRFTGGGRVPIDSPIASGEPARYHLLADFFGAQVSLLGTSLTSALAITSGYLALFVPATFYVCGRRLTGSRAAAVLGVVVFCAGGTLGWIQLGRDVADHGIGLLGALPRDYARDPGGRLWMDNPTLSYLYAQRNGLFGLPLGLVVLTLVRLGVDDDEHRDRALLAAGVLAGLLPLANGFAFVVSVALAAAWALLDRRRPWWRFFGPALALGAPVAWWLQPPQSAVRWFPWWMAPHGLGPWAWFWFRNLGPFLVLLVVACAWRGTVPRRLVRAFLPVWLLWLVPNLVAFHPWEWNNTKYFAFWQLLGAFLVGAVLVRLVRSGAAGTALAVVALLAMCLAGLADLSRAADRDAAIAVTDRGGLRAAAWVRRATDRDAVLAVAPSNTEAVMMLGGRPVVSGFPGWSFDIGVPDWYQRQLDELAILRGGAAAEEAATRRGVDYVVIGPLERAPEVGANEAWWAANATLAYRSGQWSVYAVG